MSASIFMIKKTDTGWKGTLIGDGDDAIISREFTNSDDILRWAAATIGEVVK